MADISNPSHITTSSPEDTKAFGQKLSAQLKPGQVVCLFGNLGSGKTCLAQGICRGWGVQEPVVSPSFTLLNEYTARHPIYHFDLYRLKSPDELLNIGYEEYLYGDGLVLIEWPENAGSQLPQDRLDIFITIRSPEEREFKMIPVGGFPMDWDIL
ncbi:MAG: tRNA (adenosine(37)-N6)-threonylcarbamoyltransferase complex ATPase subunit type 1 TsaE [Candidatus Edwardsbacteria bacterium]|nr:tRNA (adenosine(37)-N6)-threonylcarbamoyltransferase complex ATPase subunit type 1 TsaE [Candidatus Edwardsbacteria bacterium]MBU1576313.1 tRNA (adenosine(37)-N6)-threonylcarbamoyltransferase complex ATPase subunit type 1 TsaE [Candidatus Edwardsbacteria bacterium]MBU2463252.1 tRNA (adenosine(37)-N6)-threonylcarbamoyltransferase complex ATPase subunit type 1 TsaE [Candidatus Edwardsbacteria bacterium]MBU2593926.1 tRNA (adenosine(37)-N6)-threonylcarbamoyltransferase complex ATPase subunit type